VVDGYRERAQSEPGVESDRQEDPSLIDGCFLSSSWFSVEVSSS
jgi:hypothetical protein